VRAERSPDLGAPPSLFHLASALSSLGRFGPLSGMSGLSFPMAADVVRQRLKRKGVHPQYRAGAIMKAHDDLKSGRLNLVDAFNLRYFELLFGQN
jgi:hypothetical protein